MVVSYNYPYLCMLTWGVREPPEVLEIFCILIYMVIAQASTFIKQLI